MILQALRRYYDALEARGAVRPLGRCEASVSFALSIDQNGTLQGVIPLKIPSGNGRKEVPQSLEVPERVKGIGRMLQLFVRQRRLLSRRGRQGQTGTHSPMLCGCADAS